MARIGIVTVPVKMSMGSLWSIVDARRCRLPVRTFGQRADHDDRTAAQMCKLAPILQGSSVKYVSSWNSEAER
jgi:hypothetical protein